MQIRSRSAQQTTSEHTGDSPGKFLLLDRLLLIMFIIGIHLRLSLRTNDAVLVPMYLSLISGAILTYRSSVGKRRYFKAFSPLGVFLVAMWAVSAVSGGDILQLTKGAVQFYLSIVVAFGVALSISRIEPRQAVRFFTKIWTVFFILAIIERYAASSLFRSITDAIYSGMGRSVYDSLDRDASIYGQTRPHVFASEPSFLAYTLNILCILIFFKQSKINKNLAMTIYIAMVGATTFISPSFTEVFFVGAIGAWYFWPKSISSRVIVMVTSVVFAVFAYPLLLNSDSRFTISEHQNSGSFFGRIIAGPPVALEALSERPLFGYGVGDADAVTPIIVDIWNRYGAFSEFPWYIDLKGLDLMSNGFWWQWIYFGIIGGILYVGVLFRLMKVIGAQNPMRVFVCSCLVWYAGAALVDIASWYVFIAFLAGALGERKPNFNARRGIPLLRHERFQSV